MICEKCGKEFDEKSSKVGWNAVKCPHCGHIQTPESMRTNEKESAKFSAIAIEGNQSLTVIYRDIHNRIAIRQFWFDIREGKFVWDAEEIYIEPGEAEDFKAAIAEI